MQRGRRALQQDGQFEVEDGITYDGVGISACGSESIEGGKMTGYELRLHGREQRGEIDQDPSQEARNMAQSSGGSDLLPPEADLDGHWN